MTSVPPRSLVRGFNRRTLFGDADSQGGAWAPGDDHRKPFSNLSGPFYLQVLRPATHCDPAGSRGQRALARRTIGVSLPAKQSRERPGCAHLKSPAQCACACAHAPPPRPEVIRGAGPTPELPTMGHPLPCRTELARQDIVGNETNLLSKMAFPATRFSSDMAQDENKRKWKS